MENIITEKKWIESFDGTYLYYAKDIPRKCKAIIILLHGFTEHLGRYDKFKEKLNSYGYGVYRYDYRGHGKSEGKRGYIKDFFYLFKDTDVIVEKAKINHPHIPIFMFGFSLGGFIALAYGIKYGEKLNGQILSAPASIKPPLLKGPLGMIIKTLYYLFPNYKITCRLWRLFMKNQEIAKDSEKDTLLLNYATLKFHVEFLINGMNWLNNNLKNYNIPCFIIHGANDKVIYKESSKNISSKYKEIKIYENLSHELINDIEEERILKDINNWIFRMMNSQNGVPI